MTRLEYLKFVLRYETCQTIGMMTRHYVLNELVISFSEKCGHLSTNLRTVLNCLKQTSLAPSDRAKASTGNCLEINNRQSQMVIFCSSIPVMLPSLKGYIRSERLLVTFLSSLHSNDKT